MTVLQSVQTCLFLLVIVPVTQGIANSRCYGRLERALDDMLHKSAARSQSRSLIDLTGYRTHYDFNPEWSTSSDPIKGKALEWNTETRASEVKDLLQQFKQQQLHYDNVIQPSRVEVSDIKFRVPRNAKWVICMEFSRSY